MCEPLILYNFNFCSCNAVVHLTVVQTGRLKVWLLMAAYGCQCLPENVQDKSYCVPVSELQGCEFPNGEEPANKQYLYTRVNALKLCCIMKNVP